MNRLQKNRISLLGVLTALAVLFLNSCGVDKFISEGEYLLNKNRIEIDKTGLSSDESDDISEAISGIKSYLVQPANTSFLGMRYAMRIYCLSSATDSNWLNRFIRSQGEAPVIYNPQSAAQTARQMELLLESRGCFGSTVVFDTQIVADKKLNVVYRIKPTPRYRIGDVSFTSRNAEVQKILDGRKSETLIKSGDYYDQTTFSKERDAVSELLQNQGFYTAAKEAVYFRIDTTIGNRTMNVDMRVRRITVYNPDGTEQRVQLARYSIDKVYVYPELESLVNMNSIKFDTTVVDYFNRRDTVQYYFLTNRDMSIRPQTICRSLYISPGRLYRSRAVELTYSTLWALRNFKFADIEFVPSAKSSDTMNFLNARIRLMKNMQRSMSVSLELSNTSPLNTGNMDNTGNFGLELGLGYQNKNLFGGAEFLNIKTSLAVELSKFAIFNNKGGDFYNLFSTFETGLDISLDIPTFLIPFNGYFSQQRIRPHTIFNLGVNYQYRIYFERFIANTAFGYNWQGSRYLKHQLLPVELTLVKFLNKDADFANTISNQSDLRLKYQYTDHLILNTRYNLVYSTQSFNTKKDFSYFSFGIESAGNLLHAVSSLSNAKTDSAGIYQIADIPFSQYVRMDFEWKRYFYFSARNNLVLRAAAGIGLPYLNSISMPYEKSFYGGGPSNIRAWRIRTLGPGGFVNTSGTKLERVGDISLTFNIEDRFKLFSIFEGAIFADAGNVWLLRESPEFPDGEFKFGKFLSQMALGAGLGLRANISILTLRLDFAVPIYEPGATPENRWTISDFSWRNIVTNFGIDYPF